MINSKSLCYSILNDSRLINIIGEDNILDSYPNEVEIFPCVIFLDENQRDVEFADNKPKASSLSYQIHIFTKALDGYPTDSEIAMVVAEIMGDEYFSVSQNRELSDVDDDTKHRVMTFKKNILS